MAGRIPLSKNGACNAVLNREFHLPAKPISSGAAKGIFAVLQAPAKAKDEIPKFYHAWTGFFVGPFVHDFCFWGQPFMLGEFSSSQYIEPVLANKPGTLVVMLADNKISKLQDVFRPFIESTLKKGPTIEPTFADHTFSKVKFQQVSLANKKRPADLGSTGLPIQNPKLQTQIIFSSEE